MQWSSVRCSGGPALRRDPSAAKTVQGEHRDTSWQCTKYECSCRSIKLNWANSMRRECLSLENFPASFGHPAWKDYARHLMSTEHTRSCVLGLKEIICNIISTSQVGPSFCLIRSFCIRQIYLGCFESFYNKEKQNFRPGKSCTHPNTWTEYRIISLVYILVVNQQMTTKAES